MLSSSVLTLLVIPAVYSLWKEWEIGRVTAPATATMIDPAGAPRR